MTLILLEKLILVSPFSKVSTTCCFAVFFNDVCLGKFDSHHGFVVQYLGGDMDPDLGESPLYFLLLLCNNGSAKILTGPYELFLKCKRIL